MKCGGLLLLLVVFECRGFHYSVDRGSLVRLHGKKITGKNTGGSIGETADRKSSVDLPSRLFFTNVRYDIEDEELEKVFAAIGQVKQCKIICDPFTGRSKGWGFVTFSDPLHATAALRSLNGYKIHGRPLKLDEATSLAKRRKQKKAAEGYAKRQARREAEAAQLTQEKSTPLPTKSSSTAD